MATVVSFSQMGFNTTVFSKLQDSVLMAYQIAFDLYESATQQFLGRVLQALRATAPIPMATNKIVKVPVEGAAKEETSGESSSEVTEEEKKPERKMESLVSQMKSRHGSCCIVCLSNFERTALKLFKYPN
jgi:ribosome maturation protein Sdo1